MQRQWAPIMLLSVADLLVKSLAHILPTWRLAVSDGWSMAWPPPGRARQRVEDVGAIGLALRFRSSIGVEGTSAPPMVQS